MLQMFNIRKVMKQPLPVDVHIASEHAHTTTHTHTTVVSYWGLGQFVHNNISRNKGCKHN